MGGARFDRKPILIAMTLLAIATRYPVLSLLATLYLYRCTRSSALLPASKIVS